MSSSLRAAPAPDNLAAQGAAAAELLLDEGVEAGTRIADPFKRAFSQALVDGLSAGLANPRGWMRNVLDGTGRIARNLNVEPEHGFVELVQNADDVGARTVRFAMSRRHGREVLVVHNGKRVEAPHVLGMTLALVSTKPDDASATGKFGIGLKTVTRLADSFQVHCAPYHFAVVDQRLSAVPSRRSMPKLFRVDAPDTLLALSLRDDYPDDGLAEWFERFGPESLLFMRSVRRLELRADDGTLLAAHELKRGRSRTVSLKLAGRRCNAEELELRDAHGENTWWRITVLRRPPSGVQRTDKATPAEAPFAVAYSSRPGTGRLFAGLPLAVGGSLPFSLNALFDTDAPRSDLLQGEWNKWVLDELAELSAAGAIRRLSASAATGWSAVPLQHELQGVLNAWLARRLTELVVSVQQRVREHGRLPCDGEHHDLNAYSAEEAALEPLIEDAQLVSLARGPVITRSMRDGDGRWRAVLDELEVTAWVTVRDAVAVFAWGSAFSPDGPWCVAFIDAALRAGLGDQLSKVSCLRLEDGSRLAPSRARAEGLLLGASIDGHSLSEHLGLIRPLDAAFLADEANAQNVRQWLQRDVGVRTRPTAEDALVALSTRSTEMPLPLDDQGLLLLREALRSVAAGRAASLAVNIGRRVLVDGRTYHRGRWHNEPVRPSAAYVPSTIDTGQDTWAKAAGETAALKWVHPRYARDLRPKRPRRRHDSVDPAEARQQRATAAAERRGVLSLFHDLGAETAPRLKTRPQNDSRYGVSATKVRFSNLTVDQREALGGDTSVTGLRDDRVSPDLEAVVADIAKAKVPEARLRARALLTSLSRAWPRLYAQHETCEAVHAYGTMQHVANVPSTWIGRAAAARWMTNELGHRKPPRELAVRTMAFEAIFGDAPRLYAHGLGPRDLDAHAVRGFRFMREPRASTLIGRLEELRDQELRGKRIEPAAVTRCYLALSEAAPPPDVRRRRLDDMTLTAVQKRFKGTSASSSGLVRSTGGWRAPGEVLLGRPIFKRRGNFVANDAAALWRVLDIHPPSVGACAKVLDEVAASGVLAADDVGVLIETYRYLATQAEGGVAMSSGLRAVPLWNGSSWTRTRPAFAVADPALQVDLATRVHVWYPPVRVSELINLLKPMKVTYLDEATFRPLGINSGSLAAGSALQNRFHEAAAHLSDWLALTDAELHDKVADLPELRSARVAVNSGLHVEIPIPGYETETVRRQAHAQRLPGGLLFAFARAELLNDGEVVGRLLAHLLDVEDRAQVVLAHGWLLALESVDRDEAIRGLQLATPSGAEQPGGKTPPPSPGKSTVETKTKPDPDTPPPDPEPAPESRPPPPELSPRHLKRLSDITVDALWSDGEGVPGGGGGGGSGGGGLKPPQPPGPPGVPPAPGAGPASWTPEQRETLGFRLLARELKNRYGVHLTDTRKQSNVGADAVDEDGRFYELKAHAGELPDSVGLEPSEFLRAQEQKNRFILAVVAGLEDGYAATVRLVADPLRRLRWEPDVDIQVHGLTKVRWAPKGDLEA